MYMYMYMYMYIYIYSLSLIFHWCHAVPCPGHPQAGIVRPPKPRIFKDKPTTTGLAQAQGQGQAQVQGQGARTSGQNTHSRRRAKRGGGSAAALRNGVLDSGIKVLQILMQMSLAKILIKCPWILPSCTRPYSSPCARTFIVGAYVGPWIGVLEHLLAEKNRVSRGL